MGGPVMETSVEVWNALAALLKYGPLAVVWSQGNGHGGFDTFDTVIQMWGNEIRQRTYCQEKPATATRRAEPAEFRFSDAFPRDRAPFAHWVYLEFLLDLVECQHRALREGTRPTDERDGGTHASNRTPQRIRETCGVSSERRPGGHTLAVSRGNRRRHRESGPGCRLLVLLATRRVDRRHRRLLSS